MIRTMILGVLPALMIVGCQAVNEAPPVDRFYRVAVDQPPPAGQPILEGALMVGRLDADGLTRERPVIYSADDDVRSLAQHDYELWIEPPPRLLGAEMVRYLRSAEIADSVVTPDLRVRSDFEIIGTIQRFERQIGRSGPSVTVSLDLALIDRDTDQLRVIDDYSAEVTCSDSSMDAAVTAFNEAIAGVFAEFLADIRDSEPTERIPMSCGRC